MFTIVETQLFQRQWPFYWTEVVPLTLYSKAETNNISAAKLKEIRRALEE